MIGQEVFFLCLLEFSGFRVECGNECVVGEVFMSGGGFCRWSVCYFLCLGEGVNSRVFSVRVFNAAVILCAVI